MFSWIYKFRDDGRHGCGMRWCWSCKTAHALWKAKSPFVNIAKVSKHFHGTCVNVLNKSGLEILAILQDHDVGADALLQHLTDMFGPLPDLKKVVDMFIRLHKGLHEKVEVVETVQADGKLGKRLARYSLCDRLAYCANLKGEGECHTGCPFHDESLLVHLIAAAVFAAISAMHVSDEVAYAAFVTALFHDCGKPASKKGGEGLCTQHYTSTVSNPCNHDGPGQCPHHHGCSNTNTSVIPLPNWSPFVAGTDIMNKIHQFLADKKYPDAIIEPPADTPSWKIPDMVKAQLPPFLHEAFDAMIKQYSRPCDCARYPGHGLLGAICLTLFKRIIADTMPETMTPMDRVATVDAMIRTVQIHMALHNCGNAEVCHKVLAHEDHLVRILASHMYVGDNLGKIRSKAYQEKVPFNEAYDQFVANMDSLPVHTSLVALNQGQKVSILLQGPSGSGKSSFVQDLCTRLHECHRLTIISRDEHIAGIITECKERLTEEQYALMYAIYNACKSYHKDSSKDIAKVHNAITNAQNGGLQLSATLTNITEQSVPNVMKLVDTAFTEAYNTALDSNEFDVIVVDSCLTLWETAVQQHLPRLSETIVITVPIINYAGIVSKANGLDEQGQMRLSGANTLHCPANGEFASPFFDPYGKKSKNICHQAPPVILTMHNGVISVDNSATLKWIRSALGDQPIIHPTRVDTSGMNGGEFMQYLVEKHKGDMLRVRDELFKVWDVTMNGVYPHEHMSVDKKTRIMEELVKYTSILHGEGILDKPITKEEFDTNEQLFWNTIMSITVVKYKDGHSGSKFWRKSMRHFRGITIFTHPITRKVTVLRYLMDRGAEIHSKVTHKRAKGQDDCDTYGEDLDRISKCLLDELQLNAFLTQKADGSLGTFTVYSGMALNIMKAYVETWGTAAAKEIAKQSFERTQGKFMAVLATQGTKSITSEMIAFATTSVFGGIRDKEGNPLVSREEMSNKTPLQIWEEHGSKVLDRIFALHGPAYEKYPDESITLMFEMICAKNRDAFPADKSHKVHDEFACDAKRDQFLCLGLGYASLEVNIPHCVMDLNGAFQQPAFWKIESGEQVNKMITDLQRVMCRKMAIKEFLVAYPPMNPDEFDELHPEGFVLYGYVSIETTAIHTAYGLPGILTYAKVKTLIYYMAHKFKVENLDVLVKYGQDSPGHFPLCDMLYNIYSSGKLQQLMTSIHEQLVKMLDLEAETSQLKEAIAKLDVQEGTFGMPPLERLKKIKTADRLTSFIGALLKEQATPKDVALSQELARMLTNTFIKGWNTTFETSIQTLEEVTRLDKEGSAISMTAKARELFDEKVVLAKKGVTTLLKIIKLEKPWNEEWQSVTTCTDVPTLLKNQLITQIVELQNKALVALPTKSE